MNEADEQEERARRMYYLAKESLAKAQAAPRSRLAPPVAWLWAGIAALALILTLLLAQT